MFSSDPPIVTARSSLARPGVEGRDNVTLSCRAAGSPAPSLAWTRASNPRQVLATGPRLVFTPLDRRDDDTYNCVAENQHGTSQKSVRLEVYCEYPAHSGVAVKTSYQILLDLFTSLQTRPM